MPEMVACPVCHGRGYTILLGWAFGALLESQTCWKCNGRGKILVYTYQEVDRILERRKEVSR